MRRWTGLLVSLIVGLWVVGALPGGSMRADGAGDPCPNGFLSPGDGGDLEITAKACSVRAGTYRYRNVNIWGGGSLTFLDDKGSDDTRDRTSGPRRSWWRTAAV